MLYQRGAGTSDWLRLFVDREPVRATIALTSGVKVVSHLLDDGFFLTLDQEIHLLNLALQPENLREIRTVLARPSAYCALTSPRFLMRS